VPASVRAPPTPSSAIAISAHRSSPCSVTSAELASAYLATFVSASAATKYSALVSGREAAVEEAVEDDRHRRPGRERLQRRQQPALGQQCWMQAARELPQLGERGQQIVDAALNGCRGGRLGRGGHEPQRQRNGDEVLLGAVVEIALDPAASIVGGLDDPGARLLELDPRVDVGDRLRDELGERAKARLRVRWERPLRRARGERPHRWPPTRIGAATDAWVPRSGISCAKLPGTPAYESTRVGATVLYTRASPASGPISICVPTGN
jgi:hypothetical protein